MCLSCPEFLARRRSAPLSARASLPVRQRGSHVVMKRILDQKIQGCTVPLHKELAIGTLHGILRQAQISVDEFTAHL